MSDAAKKPEPKKEKDIITGEAPAKKMKLDILTLIILLVVLINAGIVGGLGVYMKKMGAKIYDLQVRAQKAEKEAEQIALEEKEKEKTVGKELHPQAQGTLYPMESFLVNISSDTGPKFLQTQMEFELSDPALEDEVTRKKAALRDAVIVLLSSRNFKELREPNGMKLLRQSLLKSVNSLLTTGKIREIYFTQFHFN